MTIPTNPRELEEEDGWKAYAKAKITKGLADIAAGQTVSREEFLAEIEERHHFTIFK
jgi:predicted transcriptional regulator